MDDPSALLTHPARIVHDVMNERSKDERNEINIYEEYPVKVLIYSNEDFDETPMKRSYHGPTHHTMVSYCGGYGYGTLPLWLTYLQNGIIDLSVIDGREQERREMQDLNERLAGFIEKVRFLEAQNKRLSNELNDIKQKWVRETKQVKVMYELELSDTRKLLDDLDKDKARLEIKVTSLEEQLMEANKKIEDLEEIFCKERSLTNSYLDKFADLESNCNFLRRRLTEFEINKEINASRITKLNKQLEKTRSDLDDETLLHMDAENRRQSLEEQLKFTNIVHDQEMRDLASLVCMDSTSENREFWRREMDGALKEIIGLFEDGIEKMKDDVESSYDWKIQEYIIGLNKENLENSNLNGDMQMMKNYLNETNTKLLKTQEENLMLKKEVETLKRERDGLKVDEGVEVEMIVLENIRLKSELKGLMDEFNLLNDTKLSLDKEMLIYNKLIENGQDSISKETVDHEVRTLYHEKTRDPHTSHMTETTSSEKFSCNELPLKKTETSSKVRVEKLSKGSLSVVGCADDGSFVSIENFGVQEEYLNGWYLEQSVDDALPIRFNFYQVTISPGMRIKIWSEHKSPFSIDKHDLIFVKNSWKIGCHSTIILCNALNEEKASYVQKTKSI